MDYLLITEYSTKKLQVAVNEQIKLGYRPVGGLCAVMEKRAHATVIYHKYTQAMFRDVGPA